MNTTARDRRRALAFVIASLLLIGAVLAVLRGVRLARHERSYFVDVPDSVAGLRAGSTVEYKGVPVGVVRSIDFRQGSVETVVVELAVREGVPIKRDTRARLRPQGITGLNVLELVGGTARAPDLPEGGEVPIEPSVLAALEITVREVGELVHRLAAATASIDSQAGGAIADLRATLVAGSEAARTLDATAAAIGSEVLLSGAAFRASAEDVHATFRDPAWHELGPEVLGAIQDMRRAAQRLESAAAETERVARDNQADVRAAIENLRGASADVRAATRRVKTDPASLLVEHPRREKPIPDPLPPLEDRP